METDQSGATLAAESGVLSVHASRASPEPRSVYRTISRRVNARARAPFSLAGEAIEGFPLVFTVEQVIPENGHLIFRGHYR